MRLIIHRLLSYLITPAHVQQVNIVLLANPPRYIRAPVALFALGKVIPTLRCALQVLTKPSLIDIIRPVKGEEVRRVRLLKSGQHDHWARNEENDNEA